MSIFINDYETVKIIDRTIPELFKVKADISRIQIIAFCHMLQEIGVDIFEVSYNIIAKIGRVPMGIHFLCRINSIKELRGIIGISNISILIEEETLKNRELMEAIYKTKASVTLELKSYLLEELRSSNVIKEICELTAINNVRLTGPIKLEELESMKELIRIYKESNIKIDICQDNEYETATAIALEAIMQGIRIITASFMGFGKSRNYCAIEEVLLFIKVQIYKDNKLNFNLLPEIGELFKSITEISIPTYKPILGDAIFKYESGVHADGIEKNPITYEPFPPELIGQKRSMSIGKHSGKRAIVNKLRMLGIAFDMEVLPQVLIVIREKSIELKMELNDEEIRKICGELLWV